MIAPLSVTAILLAGRRNGQADPLAAHAGVSHKSLVPVAGRPMLLHALDALAALPSIGHIRISIDDPDALSSLPAIATLQAAGRVSIVTARPNLVDSVVAATQGAPFPFVVTTADNVLLTPDALRCFMAEAVSTGCAAAVALARREDVLAAHPDGQRRFYAFADGAFSNCSTYWIGDARALGAAEAFRSGGQFAKFPARMLFAFGLINLLRFRFGADRLRTSFGRLSRRFGLNIEPVMLADGAVAIDVDNLRTLDVAEQVLAARKAPILNAA